MNEDTVGGGLSLTFEDKKKTIEITELSFLFPHFVKCVTNVSLNDKSKE